MHYRGVDYAGEFRSVTKSSLDAKVGYVRWRNNWTTFLDGLWQLYVLGMDTREARVPIMIRKIVIDTKDFENAEEVKGDPSKMHF